MSRFLGRERNKSQMRKFIKLTHTLKKYQEKLKEEKLKQEQENADNITESNKN